jgi:hypothetical protein
VTVVPIDEEIKPEFLSDEQWEHSRKLAFDTTLRQLKALLLEETATP